MDTVANGERIPLEQDHGESRQGLKSQLRLPSEALKDLKRISTLHSTWSLLHTYGLIALLIAVFLLLPHPLRWFVWPILALLMARTLHALAILMHDASHRTLYSNPKLNDFIGKWFCAYPIGVSLFAYRKLHFNHHKDLYTERDPDVPLYAGYPRSGRELLKKFGKDFFGLTTHKNYLYLMGIGLKRKGRGKDGKDSHDLVEMAAFHLILWIVLIATGWWKVYVPMIMIPALTFLQVSLRFRGAAEHAAVPDVNDSIKNVRTTIGNPLSRFMVAPLMVNYHLEHHLYPGVPHYNLPKIHQALKAQGSLGGALICPGYWDFAKSLYRKDAGSVA